MDEQAPPPPADATPADTEPNASSNGFATRAKLRRRLRYLRRARELGYRDLGGFLLESFRANHPQEQIVVAKLRTLERLDGELRTLEAALRDHRETEVLREPGITVCPRCGVLGGSDANFCSGCGLARDRSAALPLGATAPPPAASA